MGIDINSRLANSKSKLVKTESGNALNLPSTQLKMPAHPSTKGSSSMPSLGTLSATDLDGGKIRTGLEVFREGHTSYV